MELAQWAVIKPAECVLDELCRCNLYTLEPAWRVLNKWWASQLHWANGIIIQQGHGGQWHCGNFLSPHNQTKFHLGENFFPKNVKSIRWTSFRAKKCQKFAAIQRKNYNSLFPNLLTHDSSLADICPFSTTFRNI